jgi:hypothetical protein
MSQVKRAQLEALVPNINFLNSQGSSRQILILNYLEGLGDLTDNNTPVPVTLTAISDGQELPPGSTGAKDIGKTKGDEINDIREKTGPTGEHPEDQVKIEEMIAILEA